MSWNLLCLSKKEGGMGFRDMELFNLFLLAKQAWRILNYPHLLVYRLLKANIFPHVILCKRSSEIVQRIRGEGYCMHVSCSREVYPSENRQWNEYTYMGGASWLRSEGMDRILT